MNSIWLWILLLLAGMVWWQWRLRRRVPTADPAALNRWLTVLCDPELDAEAIEQHWRSVQGFPAHGLPTPADFIDFSVNDVLPPAYAFAVDWKDGESFADYADDMAARFGFRLQWPPHADPEQTMPETLMQLAYPQFRQHGALLYDAQTDGDYYCVMLIPAERQTSFEQASRQWGLAIRTADEPH